MSAILLTPEKMLDIIPGEVTIKGTVDTAPDNGMSLRGYRFDKTEVSIPCMRDYELVRWKTGTSNLGFHDGVKWRKGAVGSDDLTLLARGESSRWYWMNDIEVSHIYISQGMMAKVAGDVFQQDLDNLLINHRHIVNDLTLSTLMATYEAESLGDEPGSNLYAQALELQICIHLVRHYARCEFREQAAPARLPNTKRSRLQEYIDAHLAGPLSIKDLAMLVDLSPSHFVRVFGKAFGVPPHQYVQSRRIKHAEWLLANMRDVPLKVVAIECGFSDQSHMSRLFKEKLDMTPLEFRQAKRRLANPCFGTA
jgi:AraC family transcriptional regulator